jgi:hypothetical protein
MFWKRRCEQNKIKYSIFYEPDPAEEISDEPMGYTAICTQPIKGEIRKVFADCEMWVP